jgi:glycosyltransferase involved in cell wall biosynthesis
MGLKIALIAPYKAKCGIYSYSRDLADALASLDVDVYWVRLPRFGAKTNELMVGVAESVPFKEVDLVHVQHEYGLYHNLEHGFYNVLKNGGKPIVTTMHAVGNISGDSIVNNYSNLVITHNEFCKRQYAFESRIIPHGCKSSNTVSMEEAKKIVGIDHRIPVVGYVGYISEYKGIALLIEAMIKIPRAGLLIGGGWHSGPDTTHINSLKNMSFDLLPGRCQWTGFVPEERLATIYGAINVLVYPSIYASESGALLMALGHGKAVIARRLKPFVEKEKEGALTTFKNINDLRRKIRKLLKDEDARKELEAGAKAYTEANSWDAVAKMHISEYEKVLEKPKV